MNTTKELLNKIALAENIEIDDKTLTIIARKADGALRDAESYFDQVVSFCGNKVDSQTVSKILNLIDDEIFFEISEAVLNKSYKTVFQVTKTIYENGWSFADLLDGIILHFRNILSVTITSNTDELETADVYKKKYIEYINKFTQNDLLRILNYLSKVSQELRYSQNHKLKIEISLSQLIGLEKTSTITDLIGMVKEGNFALPEVAMEKKSPYIANETPVSPIKRETTPKTTPPPAKKEETVANSHPGNPLAEFILKDMSGTELK